MHKKNAAHPKRQHPLSIKNKWLAGRKLPFSELKLVSLPKHIFMNAISVSTTSEKYVISIDKKLVQEDLVLNLVERLRMESLAEAINFDAELEQAGNDIKTEWWAKNKERLLGSPK